jgi:hypothetical protein
MVAVVAQLLWVGTGRPALAGDSVGTGWLGQQCENAGQLFVCDVGDPRPLSMRSFHDVLATDEAVRAVVRRIGMPDRVELQQVQVDWPWLAWELRAYYWQYGRVYAFARAFALDEPQISVLRYQGPIPEDKLAQISTVVARSDAADRAERDAERAERAAAEAEAKAEHADQLADRAEAISSQASDRFKSSLIKH